MRRQYLTFFRDGALRGEFNSDCRRVVNACSTGHLTLWPAVSFAVVRHPVAPRLATIESHVSVHASVPKPETQIGFGPVENRC